ncbi:ty3-gypsy retrotransposon protein [Cucumis melo var. makuwa]|uniref:Ty3-gypsy retrotransposon protein n=1 Tax=Cucumis melo var. makuwa TaxID=1194695 RepID=A0A5D3C2I6_CUCMM|nr:ty3-gypsy retrotransposon protein [Cucumis melo var. makuwa]TYK04636.1 ty3-gypsy retrotransposon protein [Cucumis melo var. makuwa]
MPRENSPKSWKTSQLLKSTVLEERSSFEDTNFLPRLQSQEHHMLRFIKSSVASKATVANDSRLVTQSHSKMSMQVQEQSSVLTKKSWEQLMESSEGGIIIRENPLSDNFTPASDILEKEPHLEVVSIMMADVTPEAAMERKINFLMKVVKEQYHEIAALKDQMKACETAESSKTPVVKTDDKGKSVLQENQTQQSISIASLSL